jgi:hypothetical protein
MAKTGFQEKNAHFESQKNKFEPINALTQLHAELNGGQPCRFYSKFDQIKSKTLAGLNISENLIAIDQICF